MQQIAIRTNDERQVRLFDVIIKNPKDITIQVKRPKQAPIEMTIEEFIEQYNYAIIRWAQENLKNENGG